MPKNILTTSDRLAIKSSKLPFKTDALISITLLLRRLTHRDVKEIIHCHLFELKEPRFESRESDPRGSTPTLRLIIMIS